MKITPTIGALISFLLILASCSPSASSVPVKSPQETITATGGAPGAAPVLVSENAAWTKIVEAAQKEGKLVAYDYFMVGDVGLEVSKAFENRYGIKMDVIPGRGADILERLKTEKRMGQMTADMVSSSSTHVINMMKDGLIDVMAGKLPVLREADAWIVNPLAIDTEGRGLAFNYQNYVPYMNTKLLKHEDAPKTLRDFLEPRWTGKIVAPDPVISNAFYQYYVPLLNRGIIDLGYLKALGDQKLTFHVSPIGAAEMLARGEFPLSVPNADSSVSNLAMQGAPIQAIPFEYNVVIVSALGAIKGAPHPNAAQVYVNWRLSKEGQMVFAKASGIASIRKDVPEVRPRAMVAQVQQTIAVTGKDMDDTARMFQERVFLPLLKK